MRRRLAVPGATLALAAVVGACTGGATPAPTTPTQLAGTSWSLGLQGGTQPAAQQPPTLAFGADGSVSGFTGCEPFTGTFTSSGASLTISGLAKASSGNQCAPSVVTAADAYLAALGSVVAWQVQTVLPTQGAKVLEPVKLILEGPTPLVFTLQ